MLEDSDAVVFSFDKSKPYSEYTIYSPYPPGRLVSRTWIQGDKILSDKQCDCCEGKKRIVSKIVQHSFYGEPHVVKSDYSPCPECGGSGRIMEEDGLIIYDY